MFFGIFYCFKQIFKAYIYCSWSSTSLRYCLNLTFNDEFEYYGSRKMSLFMCKVNV
jgi:hypothetical protein